MPLRNITPPGFSIGCAVNQAVLWRSQDYQRILATEFNLLVPENAMKIDVVRPNQDTWDYTAADAIVSFAQYHSQSVRGHVLCWHPCQPKWMRSLSNLELEQELKRYIQTTVDRYRSQVLHWDVVSEASLEFTIKSAKTNWNRIEGYFPKCYQWAKEANPQATLAYIDHKAYSVNTWDAISSTISALKASGTPIDTVGIQLHHEAIASLSMGHFRLPQLIKQLKATGVSVELSEVSVSLLGASQALPVAASDRLQSEAYSQYLKVALETGCQSMSIWGLSDAHSFYKPPERCPNSKPVLFDRELQPKPAYHALTGVLSAKVNN